MIKFIKSPVGQFGLAYFEGQTAELSEALETELIEAGYAVIETTEFEATENATLPIDGEVENAKKKVSKK